MQTRNQKFYNFLESMKIHNPTLIEAVKKGFNACFEANRYEQHLIDSELEKRREELSDMYDRNPERFINDHNTEHGINEEYSENEPERYTAWIDEDATKEEAIEKALRYGGYTGYSDEYNSYNEYPGSARAIKNKALINNRVNRNNTRINSDEFVKPPRGITSSKPEWVPSKNPEFDPLKFKQDKKLNSHTFRNYTDDLPPSNKASTANDFRVKKNPLSYT